MNRSDWLAAIAIVVSLASFAVSCWLSVRLQSKAHKFQKTMFRVKSIHKANAKLADKVAEFDSLSEIIPEKLANRQWDETLQHLGSLFSEITSIYFANHHLFALGDQELVEQHWKEFQAKNKPSESGTGEDTFERFARLLPLSRQIAKAMLAVFQENLIQILPEMDEFDE